MPTQNIHVVSEVGTLEEAFEQLAKLQKTLRYLLNGNLDFENIRAKGIIAETIDVNELSAISANLGHIIAGLIESVEIYGSFIATSKDSFPRAEMSSTNKMFKVMQSLNNYAEFTANYNSGGGSTAPALDFINGSRSMTVGNIASEGGFGIGGSGPMIIICFGEIHMLGLFIYTDWSWLKNESTGRTLKQELDSINNNISNLYSLIQNLSNDINNLSTSTE